MANELAKAMAKILGEVNRIPKNGKNTFQNYSYATEGDALDKIRPLLSEHGIAIFYDAVEVWELENNRTRVKIAIELVHGDSGESKITHSFGEARDADKQGRTQDKGIYKAITGAVKYWAFKTFLISTGDDVEADDHSHSVGRPATKKAKPTHTPTTAANFESEIISEKQLGRYYAIAKANNWTVDAQKALLSQQNITSRKAIPVEAYEGIITTLETEGMAQQWADFAAQQQEQAA